MFLPLSLSLTHSHSLTLTHTHSHSFRLTPYLSIYLYIYIYLSLSLTLCLFLIVSLLKNIWARVSRKNSAPKKSGQINFGPLQDKIWTRNSGQRAWTTQFWASFFSIWAGVSRPKNLDKFWKSTEFLSRQKFWKDPWGGVQKKFCENAGKSKFYDFTDFFWTPPQGSFQNFFLDKISVLFQNLSRILVWTPLPRTPPNPLAWPEFVQNFS